MDFYAVLDQVLDLLRQRGRVTYNALKRQFQLDEDTLNDLKDELLFAHQQVHDEAGRGLIWTSDPGTAAPATAATMSRDMGMPSWLEKAQAAMDEGSR